MMHYELALKHGICQFTASTSKSHAVMVAGAAVEFEAILHRQSGDAVAANNLAVAKMYSVDLTGAVTTLEGCLQVRPGPSSRVLPACCMVSSCLLVWEPAGHHKPPVIHSDDLQQQHMAWCGHPTEGLHLYALNFVMVLQKLSHRTFYCVGASNPSNLEVVPASCMSRTS